MEWTFLTHHAHVLLKLSQDQDARIEEIAESLGLSTRATIRVLNDLVEAGYLAKIRDGRRNHYEIKIKAPLRHHSSKGRVVGDLIAALSQVGKRR